MGNGACPRGPSTPAKSRRSEPSAGRSPAATMLELRYFPADEMPPVGAQYPRQLFTAGVNGNGAVFEWRDEWLGVLGGREGTRDRMG